MKRIILFLFASSLVTSIGYSQSVTISPQSNNFIETNGDQNFHKIVKTNVDYNSGLVFYQNTSNYGGLYLRGTENQYNLTSSYSTPGIVYDRADNKVGIGTFAPIAKLDVANNSTGSSDPSLRLVHTNASGFNRILMSNLSRSSDWMLSSNVSSTDASSRWNIWYTGIGNVFTTTGDGNVGIGSSNPTSKLEINHSYSGTPSFDAHLDLKATSTFSGINFTDNSSSNKMTVMSYTKSNTPASNYLLFNTQGGNAMIIRGDREVTHYSYTKLGQSAPGIQMKRIRGTTAAASNTNITHGLDGDKIISVTASIKSGTYYYAPGATFSTGFQYDMVWTSSIVQLNDVGASLQGDPYVVTIIYEE